MFGKKIAYAMFFAGFLPVTAFGTMAYTPSRPCSCVSGNTSCQTSTYVPMKQKKSSESGNWYVGANFMMNMWSWENDYKSDYDGSDLIFSKDTYSFESVTGFSVAVGRRFESGMRGDIELGKSSTFTDADDVAQFSMSMMYLMGNLYYDFGSGFYLGAGVGVAKPTVKVEGSLFGGSGGEDSSVSPKVGAALGYAKQVADNVFIDIRYRLSGLKGTDLSKPFLWDQYTEEFEPYMLQIESGLILENSVSVGLRYSF